LAIGVNRRLDVEPASKGAPNVLGRVLYRRRIENIKRILEEQGAAAKVWPVPIEGYGSAVEPEAIIAAIFQAPDFRGLERFKNKEGRIHVNERGETGVKGVFAGGDITVPYGLVTQAIGMGRKAAEAMDDFLREREPAEAASPPVIRHTQLSFKHYEELPRISLQELGKKFIEVDIAPEEAKRCLSCGQCFYCDNCYVFCSDKAVVRPIEKGQLYLFKWEFCKGQECNKCAEECPCGCIEMV
jgi:Pyruvate/2-oxoacid:ferredoxin oxidoreductase delta subunit